MNNQKQTHTPQRRTLLRSFVSLFALSACLACTTRATTYYQTVNQNGSGKWDDLPAWNTAVNGTGTAPTAINATDDFISNSNGWLLRTPLTATTFGGKSLTLGPSTHQLLIKGGTNTITVPNLITLGSPNIQSGSNNAVLAVTTCLNSSGTTTIGNNGATNALYTVSIGTLTGAGNFNLTGTATSTVKLSVTDATSYEGTITLTSGKLEFLNALSSAGALVVPTPGNVTINNGLTVTFTGLTVNGVAITAGQTYTAAYLGFLGNGNVTVRAPATWYLTTNETGAQDWTVAYKALWNDNTSGTGGTAPSFNPADTYSVSVGSNALRTPTTASTFAGGTLSLGGSGQLVLNGTGSVVSTIPKLASTGGTIVTGTVARNLTVNTFSRLSGTTTLSTGTGGILNLSVGLLTGAGGLTASGTGQVVPSFTESIGYTGTITVNNGTTLKVDKQLATAGSLVVNTGGILVLNDWVYVTGLTVNGVVKAAGASYSLGDLGLAGSSTGKISVYARDLSGPPQMFGVNLAGAEFSSGAFWPDTAPVWDYYKSKGLTLIRLPIKWVRLQSSLYAPLNFTKLDQVLTLARDRDMKVIVDLHNYNQYVTKDVEVGSAALPVAALQDFWSQMADHLKNNPEIYGYDIMNEPINALGLWPSTAQSVVNAIRKKDTNHYVFVEGMSSSSAWRWPTASNLDIHDPAGRLIYSAHSYWDYVSFPNNTPAIWGGDGNYETTDIGTPTKGTDNVTPFINWLKTRPYAHGHIGEYGTPNNQDVANWNIALDEFLICLKQNNISGTYWSGGAWSSYPLLCEPRPLVGGADQPQMAVLEAHNNFDLWLDQDIGAVAATGSGTYANGTFTLKGSGADIWATVDEFHYAYQAVAGDCTVTARIVSQTIPNSLTMSGLMIRESLNANSAHAYTNDVNGSLMLTWRATAGGASGHSPTVTGITLPYWVRLVRSGNTFTAYRSPDSSGTPSGWVQVGSPTTVTMTAPTVYVGMVVCSHADGALSTAVFDNVTVTKP